MLKVGLAVPWKVVRCSFLSVTATSKVLYSGFGRMFEDLLAACKAEVWNEFLSVCLNETCTLGIDYLSLMACVCVHCCFLSIFELKYIGDVQVVTVLRIRAHQGFCWM